MRDVMHRRRPLTNHCTACNEDHSLDHWIYIVDERQKTQHWGGEAGAMLSDWARYAPRPPGRPALPWAETGTWPL